MSFRRRPRQGFALVIVLVILSLLAVIAVGYLSSMASERATASAFSNKTRAEQAAQAGVDSAIGTLRDYFKAFPDSATAWDTAQSANSSTLVNQGYGAFNEGTTLYLRAMPQSNNNNLPDPAPGIGSTGYANTANYSGGNNPNNTKTDGSDNRQTFVLPLVSGAMVEPIGNKASALPTLTGDTSSTVGNSVNLNGRRQISDTEGWIGTPPGYTNPKNASLPKPVAVPWVEITQKDGYAGSTQPPVVGRYAFWVEDESFRANVSYASQGQSNTHVRRDNPLPPTPPSTPFPTLNPTDVDLSGILNVIPGSNPSSDAQGLYDTRQSYPGLLFPDSRAFAHSGELSTDTPLAAATINKLRYLTTSQSAALNLSRHGTQRLNLNTVVPQQDLPTDVTKATAIMQGQIDQIVKTIQFHAPRFGQRFFRTRSTTDATTLNDALQVPDDTHQYPLIYLYKVAANIRDYIDKDPTPTIIDPGGTVRYGAKPLHAFYGPGGNDGVNEIWAQGKDSAPFIEESATRFRGGHLTTDASKYRVAIDYYVEVWNSCNLDVKATDLGPHPVIRVANPTQWISTSPVDPTLKNTDPGVITATPYDSRVKPVLRDYDIDISGVTFYAGVATVITTDPDFKQVITDPNAQANVRVCGFYPAPPDPNAVGKRTYNGTLPFLTDGKTRAAGLKMVFGDPSGAPSTTGHTVSSDYETELVFSTDNGVIDSTEGGLPVYDGGTTDVYLTAATPPEPNPFPNPPVLPLMGGSLKGNNGGASYPDVLGDPRSNNEQLEYLLYKPSGPADQTRYYNFTAPGTLGLPNSDYVKPSAPSSTYTPWGDYYTFPSDNKMTAANAPYVIANAALTSSGQLGDIYDPLRIAPVNYLNARGGGRTFKIGQHDDRWDGDVNSASHSWAAWRLVDFFGVSDAMDQPGLINVNGVARDNGAALRAALTGFKFQPTTSSSGASAQPASNALAVDVNTTPGLQAVIDQIKARVATPYTSSSSTYSNPPQPASPNPQLFVGSLNDHTGVGPFFERGELSELPAFGRNAIAPLGTSAKNLVNNVDMATTFDRGREELFRRLVEMTTTRGSVFTVYALGQSINQSNPADPTTKHITGTQQLRVTFKLVPKNIDASNFHPATDPSGNPLALDPANPNVRFAKPDHYEVQILSATSGNG